MGVNNIPAETRVLPRSLEVFSYEIPTGIKTSYAETKSDFSASCFPAGVPRQRPPPTSLPCSGPQASPPTCTQADKHFTGDKGIQLRNEICQT